MAYFQHFGRRAAEGKYRRWVNNRSRSRTYSTYTVSVPGRLPGWVPPWSAVSRYSACLAKANGCAYSQVRIDYD